jgi:hypothetical protein
MSRVNTARQHQDVDSLVNKLANANPQAYRAVATLMVKYKRKQASLASIYKEIHDIFQVSLFVRF